VIKFVSDLWQVSGFLRVTPVSSTNNTDRHNITEILLKVELNTVPDLPLFLGVLKAQGPVGQGRIFLPKNLLQTQCTCVTQYNVIF
jgi:hypothetical protein